MIKFTDTTFVLETEEEDGIPHRPLKIGKYRLYHYFHSRATFLLEFYKSLLEYPCGARGQKQQ